MELTSFPYTFEVLQIEAVALFCVLCSILGSTWKAYRGRKLGAFTGGSTMPAILAFTAFVGLAAAFTSTLGLEQYFFSVELALGIVLSVIRPANALAFFLCLQFLRPWEMSAQNPLLLALPRMTGLVALVAAATTSYQSTRRRRFGRAQWLLLAFAVWTFLTTFVSPTPGEQQSEYFDGFFRSVLIFFLIVALVREEDDLNLIRSVYLWSVAGLACVSIYVSWDQFWEEGGVERLHSIGTLENSNDIAVILVVAVPFTLRWMAIRKRNPLALAIGVLFLLLTTFALYMAQSRGALLAFGASLIGWWVLRSKKKLVSLFLGLLLLGVATPFATEFLRRDEGDLQESSDSRLIYWNAGLRMAAKSPVYGVGYNRYPKEYQGNAVGDVQYEFGERTAHSTWILALAETGIPGFLLFVGFVVAVIRMARRLVFQEPDLFVALVAYLIAVSFLSHTYMIYLYILAGLVVSGFRLHYRSEKGWSM